MPPQELALYSAESNAAHLHEGGNNHTAHLADFSGFKGRDDHAVPNADEASQSTTEFALKTWMEAVIILLSYCHSLGAGMDGALPQLWQRQRLVASDHASAKHRHQ